MDWLAFYAVATTCCLLALLVNLGLAFRKIRAILRRLASLEARIACISCGGVSPCKGTGAK